MDFLSSIEFSKYLKFMKENHLLISNNVIKDKRLLELKEYFAVTGTKSMLDASAVIEKKLVVIICFERLSIKEWSTEEIAYMRGLSDQFIQIFLRLEESKSQYKLKDSEQKLNRFFDFAPIGIAINQMDGTFSKVNAEFSRITGYTSEELNKLSYWDLTPKEYTKAEEVQIKNIGETKAYGPYEKEYIRKNGKRIPVLLRGIIIQSGGEDFIWSVVEDITEIKKYRNNLETIVQERTEELNIALEDAENARDNIDAILKSIADGLIVTDIQNRVVLMNRVAEDLLKIKLSEVINRSIYYAIKDKTLRNLIKNTFDKIDTESQFDFKLAGKDLNQSKILRVRASIIKDKKGNNNGIIIIIQDISQEREIDKMKTEFISTAAHELRTPLTSIQGFSEILLTRDDISDQEKKKFLGHINNQATNLAQIINDLLDISRIESGSGYILEKEPCLIGEAIKSVVEPIITQTKIHKFEVVVHKKPVEIIVDKEKMAQVLENLISNAVKYSPDGGKIQIKGEIIKENYQVSIQDEGVGMTREQVEKIFDKFYRADTTNTAIEGTGLGMSIVKNIVEAHDGKVWVESEIGKGTKVTFIIPLDQNVEQLM
ncbi:MAG: PAS domain S-box protein [Bacteroidetes bacterium]|nr:PAS domain S-box protein [Bacteroidota bacterium]